MHKFLIPVLMIALVGAGCGTTEDGPIIAPDVNSRNLCNYNVSVENETRCMLDSDCSGANQSCWFSTEPHFVDKKGFCRECTSDASCDVGLQCDHGWCHKPCTTEDDCDEAGQFCTGNFCRRPHVQGTEVNFCNDGNKDLEVYLDQVTLHGAEDACVFSRLEWSQAGPTATLPPDDCGLFLNIKFTPKDVGGFRGVIKIPSNSIRDNLNPLYFFMCGQAVESVCSVSEDETCPECTSCRPEDFQSILDNEPVPNCDTYF